MIRYILSFVPLVGTSFGALLGIYNNLNNRFKEQEDDLVAVATGILGSICINLFFEAKEKVRYPSVFVGVFAGFVFIWIMEYCATHKDITVKSKLFWAMLIHNIPEGIVIGISLANSKLLQTVPLVISISLQNIPDGLVVSMPLVATRGRKKAILLGIFSGIVEPIAAILIIISAKKANIGLIEPFLIGFSFATILMITFELLKDCQKMKLVVIAASITTAFNAILG